MPRVGAKTIEESRQWLEDFMVSLGKTASCNGHVNEVAYRAGLSRSTLRNIMANEPGTGKPAGYCKALGDKSRGKLLAYRYKILPPLTQKWLEDDGKTFEKNQPSIIRMGDPLPRPCLTCNDPLFISEEIIRPIISEMRGALQGAVAMQPNADAVVNISVVRRWYDRLCEHIPEKA